MEMTSKRVQGVGVISLPEDLTAHSVDLKRAAFEGIMGSDAKNMVLDMGKVNSIDSAGIGALVSLLKLCRSRGGELRVAAANERIQQTFQITRLGATLKTYTTVEEAVEAALVQP